MSDEHGSNQKVLQYLWTWRDHVAKEFICSSVA